MQPDAKTNQLLARVRSPFRANLFVKSELQDIAYIKSEELKRFKG